MSRGKAKPESDETTTEAVEVAAAEEPPPCPFRSEHETVELTPDHERVLRVRAEVLGVSRDTYLNIFSHGVNYAKLYGWTTTSDVPRQG